MGEGEEVQDRRKKKKKKEVYRREVGRRGKEEDEVGRKAVLENIPRRKKE